MRRVEAAGAAHLVVVAGAALLRPDAQLFDAMVEGWGRQQASRQLSTATIRSTHSIVRRFQAHNGEYPWSWTPGHLEEWTSDMRSVRGLVHSTVRVYQQTIRLFLGYVCDPVYGWDRECEQRFGSHPVQICTAWNTAAHRADGEHRPRRRGFTRAELQTLFDAADDLVDAARRSRRKGLAAAYRDAALLKTTYAFGLRRREAARLEVHDFGRNPKAAEFGEFGVCNVRFGKAMPGSPPKPRGVLTVMPWSVEVLEEWVGDVWPLCRRDSSALWPSETGERISETRFNAIFTRVREHAGLPEGMGLHCLRHSYVTHLIEDGYDQLFVQQQVGHEHASTTSIYTSVASDYRTRVLRDALDKIISDANEGQP